MIIRRAVGALAAITVAGCTTLPDPVATETFEAEYTKLAACTYERASKVTTIGLRISDLRGSDTVIINQDQISYGSTPIWEARFSKAGERRTAVEIKATPTVWGGDFHAKPILGYVRECATHR